jgi:hypothetical protein
MTKVTDIQFKNGQILVFYEKQNTVRCLVLPENSTISDMNYAIKIDSE